MTHSPAALKVLPWLMACALFMETLDVTIISTAIPQIACNLHTTPITMKLALTSYLLSLAVFMPISGWAADRFGARRVFCGALILFTLGSACCGAASSVVWLVWARLLQGVGGAVMLPVARLVLLRAFPRSELVRVTNYATIPALVGPALGPVIGGFITTYMSWRWVFYVNVPFGLLGLLVTRKYVSHAHNPQAGPLDITGFVLFGLGLGGLSFGFEAIGESFISPFKQVVLLGCAGTLLALYALHARRCSSPLLNVLLLRVRTFRVTLLGSLISRLGIGGVSFLLPLMFQLGLGLSPVHAGALIVPVSLAMIVMKLFVKVVLRELGFRKTLIGNTFVLGIFIALFGTVGLHTSPWLIAALAFTYGLAASLHFSCVNALAYADISTQHMADATSIASTVQQLSMSFGVGISALCLMLMVHQVGGDANTPAPYHATFACIGLITALSSTIFSLLAPTDGAETSGCCAPNPRYEETKPLRA